MEEKQLLTEEEKQNLTVGGYHFRTKEDAVLAKIEQQKIEYIEQRLHYDRPESVLAVYQKAIENQTFQTPIGIKYLEKLHQFLEESESIDIAIQPIPLNTNFSRKIREQAAPAKKRIQPEKQRDKLKDRYRLSICINILLLLMAAAMFYITLHSDSPNILNYENVITNKYASWEQELRERENELREREKSFGIENEAELRETD